MGATRAARAVAATASILALIAPAAGRAERKGAVEVGAFGGYARKSDNNQLGNALDRNEVPTGGAGGGARIAWHGGDRWAAEIEVNYVSAVLRKSGDATPIVAWRAAALWHLFSEGRVRPFARAGCGWDTISTESINVAEPNDADLGAQLGAGARVELGDSFGARVDVLAAVTPGRGGRLEIEPTGWIGLYYQFGGAYTDKDGDGIVDRDDRCPFVAEDPDGWDDADGCPEVDNDGDGVKDEADKCPTQAETTNGFRDDDGCPDSDRDGDGIDDREDKCPQAPENRNGFDDHDGCPDDPDGDGDGVPDSRDRCPTERETANGWEDEDGCADKAADSDGDGVEDPVDKCRADPETKNGYQDGDGCPDKVPDKLRKWIGPVAIGFDAGQARLTAPAQAALDKLAQVLTELADVKVTVAVGSDDALTPDGGPALSKERGDAIKLHLLTKGLAVERIVVAVRAADARPDKVKGARVELSYD